MANGNEPATKQDLFGVRDELMSAHQGLRHELMSAHQGLRHELMTANQGLRDELMTAHQGLRDELIEVVRDAETKLLKAFYTFAESNQTRLGQVEANTNAVIARLATLESRITEVEKRLNMPPAANAALLLVQRHGRVHASGPQSRDVARQQRHTAEKYRHG